MSTRHLSSLFRPRSVAVIGASPKPNTVGSVVMRNLLGGAFAGPIMPVNPQHSSVAGVLAYPDVAAMPIVPDVAVICTPPDTVIEQVAKLGERGSHAAIVLTAGMNMAGPDAQGKMPLERLREEARRWNMRILGPNSLGLMVPGIGLNATFAHQAVPNGKIAFVSQSGALCTSVLDWAAPKGIGFSHFISMGESIDLDFGDVLDYLGSDPYTRAILLYVESIHERRNFMSAARAAARNKPVLCIKAGRVAEAAHATISHTGVLAGSDAVFDAAIRRSGMLRVYDFDELFGAVETLARSRPLKGERLAILTNGGGIGIMAVDDHVENGGTLAELSPATVEKLNAVLPPCWSHANPVDIIGDATGERYVKALNILLDASEVDGVLVMYAPTAVSSATEVAEAVIKVHKERTRANVMTCWVGDASVRPARKLFAEAGIPSYETPGSAVNAFLHLVEYRQNQDMLMEVPANAPQDFCAKKESARELIRRVLADQDSAVMSEADSKALLEAYGIPVVKTFLARNPAECSRIATEIGRPVVIKINSPDITHKTEVGGVALNLTSPLEVEKAANAMLERVKTLHPEARIEGFTVQEMVRRANSHEVILGVSVDPVFGPVILFGQGGTAVEVIGDSAVALPPLNMSLARELISRTRVFNLLKGFRGAPAADIDALCLSLIELSQMVVDLPEVVELDINPLIVNTEGVLAVDSRVRVRRSTSRSAADRLAIRPYPAELEEVMVTPDGREILLRPIRPEDEPKHHVFVSKLTPEDIRFRFFGHVGELPHSEMARLTQIDYDREMAFIAQMEVKGEIETIGVVRTFTDPDNDKAEFAIVMRSDLKGLGLGKRLMTKMIEYCRSRGTNAMVGQVLADNNRMLRFCEGLGFKRMGRVEEDIVELKLELKDAPEDVRAHETLEA